MPTSRSWGILALLLGILFVVGVFQDVQGFIALLWTVPGAFARMVVYAVLTLFTVLFFAEMVSAFVLNKSLADFLRDRDQSFERNFYLVIMVVVALVVLIAK